VSDLGIGVDFWSRQVGLPVLTSTPEFAFLDGGSLQLMLNRSDGYRTDSSTEIVLEVEDVLGSHAAMSDRGVPFEVDLRPVMSEGPRELLAAHFRDPDGNVASLTGWVTTP
jgi:hypothetical protein